MFTSIRRYRARDPSRLDELTRRVDADFADRISAQPGFVSYEFLDCGDGEVMTISIFRDADEAEASRELARRWSLEKLADFAFMTAAPLRGEIPVSRAAREMLEPGHTDGPRKFASIRRYTMRGGDVGKLMHVIDERFADRIASLRGFDAYHVVDCGRGEIVAVSMFRDRSTAEDSDE
ncbi:MAG TPA: hypothetical protein VE570_14935, partial [Thermoleophilaceae bacterium]|nr:hypothetical protein [Thermoleophilaceae bacterium]